MLLLVNSDLQAWIGKFAQGSHSPTWVCVCVCRGGGGKNMLLCSGQPAQPYMAALDPESLIECLRRPGPVSTS